MLEQQTDGRIHEPRGADGRRRPKLDNYIRPVAAVLVQPLEGVPKDRQIGGVVGCNICRTQEGDISSKLAGCGGDLLIIGRDDDAANRTRLECGSNRIRQQGITSEAADVLTRDAFGTAARRDDRKSLGHTAGFAFFKRLSASIRVTTQSSRHPLSGWRPSCMKRHRMQGKADAPFISSGRAMRPSIVRAE